MTEWDNPKPNFKWPVAVARAIKAPASDVWTAISTPGNLELCHPFCTANPVHEWPGERSRDEIHYLSGWIFERRFCRWIDHVGYDLEIGRRGGRSSFVSWRIRSTGEHSSVLRIAVYPYALQNLPTAIRWLTFRLRLKPLLSNYLSAVVKGFEWYVVHGEPVPRNHFGTHPWFSTGAGGESAAQRIIAADQIARIADVLVAEFGSLAMPDKKMPKAIQNVLIRDEKSADCAAISEVTVAAFETMDISDHTEQFIVEALRASKALTASLVAEADGIVVGHIAFSPVTLSDGTTDWYGLGPLSVHPDFQRKGIGKALIQEGLSRLRNLKAKGCCLVGHPQYYRQFGFKNVEGLVYEGVPQEVFFALSFDGNIPQGNVMFHEGFKANGRQGAPADG